MIARAASHDCVPACCEVLIRMVRQLVCTGRYYNVHGRARAGEHGQGCGIGEGTAFADSSTGEPQLSTRLDSKKRTLPQCELAASLSMVSRDAHAR